MSDCCNEFEFTNPQGSFYMDGGIRGKDGVTFYPHVSAAGILSWTNDGGKQNPDPVNIKGEDGMSAYAAAQQAGFTGTEQEFNAYLAGIGELTDDVDTLKSAINDPVTGLDSKAPAIYNTASGAIASFNDGADNMPLKSLTVNIEPVQAGTGDPSPENVRPISGWTGCNAPRCGKNLIKPAPYSETIAGVEIVHDGTGKTVLNGTASNAFWARLYNPDISFVLPAGNYILSADGLITNTYVRLSNGDGSNYDVTPTRREKSFAADGVSSITVNLRVQSGVSFSNNEIYVMIRFASDTDSAFEPYQGNTYPITFPTSAGTVYGGTLDVANGKLTVDRIIATMNGSENWQIHSTYQYAFYLDNAIPSLTVAVTPTDTRFACNRYKIGTYINNSTVLPSRDDWSVFNQTNQAAFYKRIWVKDTNFEGDLSEFKASLTENNLQIVYPLTSPIEYPLTAQQITTLLGTNNIWADCGSVSVDYPADTKLYIQKVNKPTDDDMIAGARIESGKYFLVNNTLYLSTTVIPAGDAIIPGTNCAKTNLAEALNALNA